MTMVKCRITRDEEGRVQMSEIKDDTDANSHCLSSASSTHILTETQEYDVINALKQLANACRQQAQTSDVESLSVRVKRQNAERIIKQFNL